MAFEGYYIKFDFNPRSREGSDIGYQDDFLLHNNFNPRSREGSDCRRRSSKRVRIISIHAPAKGATQHTPNMILPAIISIHAPAKGATKAYIRNLTA